MAEPELNWVHIKCSTLTALYFRIWNTSTIIPPLPLGLFVVMLPKAHLASHLNMSSSRWVITSWWLSGSLRFLLRSCSVYSCHLFQYFLLLLYCAYLFMKYSTDIFNFLEEISSLSNSIVFLCFFALFTLGRLPYPPWYSLELCIQISIYFLFSVICKASADKHFAFLHFFFPVDVVYYHLLYNILIFHP